MLGSWPAPDRSQERLRRHYLAHLARHPGGLLRDCVPGHVTASALLVDAPAGRVLLTLHARLGRWLQLGGHCERSDRTLAGAALREASEESGIEDVRLLPAPARLDAHEVGCRPGRRSRHLDVQYVGLVPPGAVEHASAESTRLEWYSWDALPVGVDASVTALVHRARALLEPDPAPAPRLQSSSGGAPSPVAAETPSR